MEDITFGLDEDLELDYETEEALRRTHEHDNDEPASPPPDLIDKVKHELDKSIDDEIPKKSPSEIKCPSRKRQGSPTWARGFLGADNEIHPARDIKRPRGKLRYQPDALPTAFFPDETDPDEPPPEAIDNHPALLKSEVASVFECLDTDIYDTEYPFNTVLVRGIEGLSHYDVEGIFAEYHPHIALYTDTSEAIVQFKLARIATKMLVGMSKPIKRVRKPKEVEEEGEIVDEDEHEGQVQTDADGDVVTLVHEPKPLITAPKDSDDDNSDDDVSPFNEEVVEVDVTKVKVPKGKWRIVTKHVASGRVIFVRYAKNTDIQKANRNSANTQYRSDRSNAITKGSSHRVKAGINVFDNSGKELPWNFEHDTRIFNDPNLDNVDRSAPTSSAPREEVLQIGDQSIRSRGRGTKRAVNLRFSSSESENESEIDEAVLDEPILDEDVKEEPSEPPVQKASEIFLNKVLGEK